MLTNGPRGQARRSMNDFCHASGQRRKRYTSEAAIIVCKTQDSYQTIEKIQADRDEDICPGIHHRNVDHDGDNEAYEHQDMLKNEELVESVTDGRGTANHYPC